MDSWTVGKWVICDRDKRCAIVTELCQMQRGTYATLLHPENRSRLCCSINMLQSHGWHKVDVSCSVETA